MHPAVEAGDGLVQRLESPMTGALASRRADVSWTLRETMEQSAEAVRRNKLARQRLRQTIDELREGRVRRSGRPARAAVAAQADVATLRDAAERLTRLLEARLDGAPAATRPVEPAAPVLTRRQLEVLALLGEGLGTGEIAGRLWLSRCTVRNHVTAVLRALDAHSRLEAVARARALQLI